MPGRINAVVGGLFDGIKNAFKTAVNWIITKWNNLELKIGGGSILGVDIPSITLSTPNIPLLAKGGIIDMAGLALVGERGPEILSLPKGAQVSPLPTGGGYAGGPITIHNEIMVNVGGAAGSADPAAIASAVQTRVDAAFRELVRAIRPGSPVALLVVHVGKQACAVHHLEWVGVAGDFPYFRCQQCGANAYDEDHEYVAHTLADKLGDIPGAAVAVKWGL